MDYPCIYWGNICFPLSLRRYKKAPSGRELAPQVTEGASGRCISGFIMGRYLLVVIVTRS